MTTANGFATDPFPSSLPSPAGTAFALRFEPLRAAHAASMKELSR
ncbi:MAG: hypothetical protein WCA21_20880 [Terracidiphilus sp.]